MSNTQHSFFFGAPDEPLLGVYYPPVGIVPQRRHGVLLCPAFGQEYLRSHRAFRQVATLLSREGFHVLRFDYFGTGDSAGLIQEAGVERWLADIGLAAQELVNITGCEAHSLLGLRLGASLALLHSSQPGSVPWSSISLWEPVVSGSDYLAEFGHSASRPLENLMGFPLHTELRDAIADIDLTSFSGCVARQFDCVASRPDPKLSKLLDILRNDATVSSSIVPIDGDWSKTDEFLSAMLPREMILRLVEGLKQAQTG